jgi:hypothetical protein
MPTISKRIWPTGAVSYQAKVRVRGYPPVTATFDRKTDAARWAQRTEAEMREGKYFPNAKAKKHTIPDLIDRYLENLKATKRRRHDEVLHLLNWWKVELQHIVLAHFRSEDAGIGATMVVQANDAQILISRIAAVKEWLDKNPSMREGELPCNFGFEKLKEFKLAIEPLRGFIEAFTYALTPPHMLEHSLAGLLSLFYPADDVEHNKELLAYYRQREWRVVGNFSVRGEDVMRLPSTELINRLLEIDAEFWGKVLPDLAGTKRTVDETLVYPGIGQRRVIEMANRVIVPAEAVDSAKAILASLAHPPPAVSITELG